MPTDDEADAGPDMGLMDVFIGENLKRLRQLAGLSQAELAERSGLFQQQTILKIEKGSRPLRLAEAPLLATLLGVSVESLLTNEVDPLEAEYLEAKASHDRAKQRVKELREQLAIAERNEENSRQAWESARKNRLDRLATYGEVVVEARKDQ